MPVFKRKFASGKNGLAVSNQRARSHPQGTADWLERSASTANRKLSTQRRSAAPVAERAVRREGNGVN